MTDRELLERAAKAAGMSPILCYESARNCLRIGDRKKYRLWRPLTDDGDAFRLGVLRGITVDVHLERVRAYADELPKSVEEFFGTDPYAATRRAIVRAAAALCE
jgi:hypothetical protein